MLHRNLISVLLFDVPGESARRGGGYENLAAARNSDARVVDFSSGMREELTAMRTFLLTSVYKSPLVTRQNAKADYVLGRLFASLSADTRSLPTYVQQRLNGSLDEGTIAHEVAFFLASLTDRGALDLYGELFVPTDRAMGHHVRWSIRPTRWVGLSKGRRNHRSREA